MAEQKNSRTTTRFTLYATKTFKVINGIVINFKFKFLKKEFFKNFRSLK